MTHRSLSTPNSGLRVFSASLLSALLIMMPFVQLAAAEKRSEVRGQRPESGKRAAEGTQQETAKNAAAENVFLNAPVPKPAPAPLIVTASQLKVTLDDGLSVGQSKRPGETITYTATIQNTNPTDDATNVVFSNDLTGNANLTFLAGSVQTQPIAKNDTFTVLGNVRIQVTDGAAASGGSSGDLLNNDYDPDTAGNTGLTITTLAGDASAPFAGTSVRGGNVTATAGDGAFEYNPPAGYEGTDSFTYTVTDADGKTDTATVNVTITGMVWFINNASTVCTSRAAGCGRVTEPFSDLQSFQAAQGGAGVNNGDAVDPEAGDNIFLYTGNSPGTPYTAPLTLLNTQKLIGQGATDTLVTISGVTVPSFSDSLPTTNEPTGTNPTPPTITSAAGGILLANSNTLRGFNVGNVGAAQSKIQGTNFGTLTVGKTTEPDVSLSGTGRMLNLTTGSFAAGSGFNSAASTSSSGDAAIFMSGITGAGVLTFASVSVGGAAAEGIEVIGSTADINFGNVVISAGTDGVSLANNSAGTRTFGSLSITGVSGIGFRHFDPDGATITQTGGGNVTVPGAATLSSTGSAISVSAPAATTAINFQGATSATTTGAGTAAVNWVGASNTSMTFNSLSITRNNGTALNASGGGTITVTNATGSITNTTPGGAAIIASNITLNANFSQIHSTAGTNGVSLTGVLGTSNLGGGQLTGTASGVTFVVNGGTASVTYSGNITQSAVAAPAMVSIIDHGTGTITFQTGTLSATTGTGISLDNADGIYNFGSSSGTVSLAGGDAGIDIIDGSGGTISFANTTINNPSGVAVNVDGSGIFNPVTGGITIAGSISKTSGGRLIDFNEYDTGTANISATLSCTTSCGGIEVTNDGAANSGILNFTAATKTLNTGGNTAVNLDNNDAGNINFTGGGLDIDTTSGFGFSATNGGTVTVTTGANPNTIDSSTGTALNVTGTNIGASGLTFRSINSTGSSTASGIILDTTGASGGLTVTGNGGTCTSADQSGCSGGTIANKTGADGSTTQGSGIYLNSTSNVSLTRMFLHDFQNFAIRGTTVTGFTLANSLINGANGTNAGFDEGSVSFTNLTGVAAITTVNVSGGFEDNFRVVNSTGSLNRITFTSLTIGANNTASGDNGLFLQATNNSTLNATITNSFFTSSRGDLFQFDVTNTAVADLIVTGTAFSNNHPAVVVGGGGVTLSGGGTGSNINFTYDLDTNTFQGARGDGILSAMQLASTGTMSGRIRNNTLGAVGVDRSASLEAQAIEVRLVGGGTQSITLHNNIVRDIETTHVRISRWQVQGAKIHVKAALR